VVSILATKGRCERASIDEVYLDLTDAAEMMLSETPPEVLDKIDEEVLKSHVLGLHVVRYCLLVHLHSLCCFMDMNTFHYMILLYFGNVRVAIAEMAQSCRKQLGGKLGSSLQTDLGANTVGDLLQFSKEKLQEHYGVNTG
ncbi:hypothetical protein B296_00055476, partial [Ensete ventricosum]